MGRRKLEGKKPDIDGAVAYIISKFHIATGADIDALIMRMDRLEANLKRMLNEYDTQQRSICNSLLNLDIIPVCKAAVPIYETVLDLIREAGDGVDFKTLYRMTGLEEKTLRNTLYRLTSTGKAITTRRGVYVVASNDPELVKNTWTHATGFNTVETEGK